jgi:hypothetical protein
MVGAPGTVAVQVIVQTGVDLVTPVAEFVIAQLNVDVPTVLLPVTVVDAEDGEVIVQFTPVTDHTYVKVPPPVLFVVAVIVEVVTLLSEDTDVEEMSALNADMTKPKNADIYFIFFKSKINNIIILSLSHL